MGQPVTINDIECTFFLGADGDQGGIEENYSLESGPEARCMFKCAWEDRSQLIRGLLGTVGYANGTVSRTPPFAYPLDQTQSGDQLQNRWICTSCGPVRGIKWRTDPDGSETFTGVPGWGFYEWAVFEAVFNVPLWQVDDLDPGSPLCDASSRPYVVTKSRTSGEVFAPPTGSVIYGGGKFAGKALQDVNASLIRTRTEFSVTLIRMPIVPFNTVAGDPPPPGSPLIGSVNAKDIPFGGYLFPKGSILLTGLNSEPRPDPCNFGIVQDVEITMLANGPASAFQNSPAGGGDPLLNNLDWNYFVDPSGKWVPCVFNQDPPAPVFAYEDFSVLFQAAIT
jgi:hypothetical protein